MGDKQIIVHFFEKLFENPIIKGIAGFFIWLLKIMFGTVFRQAYGVVAILWIADTITGYYHAWANPKIVPESRRMYHGLVKLSIYYSLLFLGHQIGKCATEVTGLIQTTFEVAIILTEGKSFLENLDKITRLKRMEIPLLKFLLRVVQGKIDAMNGVNIDGSERVDHENE